MYDNGDVNVKKIDNGQVSFVVNGHRFKLYHIPISKEDFIHVMSTDRELELVDGEVPSPSPCSGNLFLKF
jgi:hypothetical protein